MGMGWGGRKLGSLFFFFLYISARPVAGFRPMASCVMTDYECCHWGGAGGGSRGAQIRPGVLTLQLDATTIVVLPHWPFSPVAQV